MSDSSILYGVDDDGIATITLNRPERLNAFNQVMAEGLVAMMDEVDSDDEVRAVVVTGAGRAYSAGLDLTDAGEVFGARDESFEMDRDADYGGVIARRFFESTKPLIAAINGPAVGLGISSTLPMDVRLASENARMGFVFTRRGLVPEACSSWFLPRLVGISRAAEWVYSGRVFDAAEALAGGLVRSVHPPADLLPAAYALARQMTEDSAPVAVAVSRRMLWQMLGASSPVLAHEIDSRGIFALAGSADAEEGTSAFLQKRAVSFPMRVSTDLPSFFDEWRKIGDTQRFLDARPDVETHSA